MLPQIIQERIGNENQGINARDIWEKLEIKRPFSNWFPEQVNRLELIENINYVRLTTMSSEGRGGQNRVDYLVTVDTAKNICAASHTKLGNAYRKALIDLENRQSQIHMVPAKNTPAEIASREMTAYLQIAEMMSVPKRQGLIEGVKYVRKAIGIDLEPLLLASPDMDDVPDDEVYLEPTELGKRHHMTGAAMNKILAEMGLQYHINGQWQPTDEGRGLCTRHQWVKGSKSDYNWKWNVMAVEAMMDTQERH